MWLVNKIKSLFKKPQIYKHKFTSGEGYDCEKILVWCYNNLPHDNYIFHQNINEVGDVVSCYIMIMSPNYDFIEQNKYRIINRYKAL